MSAPGCIGPSEQAPPAQPAAAGSLQHGAPYALALGTLAVGTEGFMIAALLPTISHALSVSVKRQVSS